MSELLDLNGPWSKDLIAIMIPVAIEMQLEEAEAMYTSTLAAVSSLFTKKVSEQFTKSIREAKSRIRKDQLKSRGVAPENTAATMMDIFSKMGLKMQKMGKKSGKSNKSPKATRIHKK